MKKKLLLFTLITAAAITAKASTTDTAKVVGDPPLTISGSVDTYYKYDFSGHNNIGFPSNGYTYFANEQNSVSIGMVDLALKKKVGKAAFVGEVAFGPRSDASIPNANYHVQNLYVSYDVSDKFNLTAGYMATFVGYEVISPVGNFNYSTSYLFSYGPFQNAGFKATYAFSDKVSLMAGIFNDHWNVFTADSHSIPADPNGEVSTFGAQLMVAPLKGWTAYVNLLTGPYSGTIVDLTTAYQITDAFKLGLNAAEKSGKAGVPSYEGIALYPQFAVSKAVTFGLRGELFKLEDVDHDVKSITLTSNIKAGPLTFIPEIRLDSSNTTNDGWGYTRKDGTPTRTASQFVLAAVYAF